MKRRPHNRRQLTLIAGLIAASVVVLSAQEHEEHPAPITVSGNASLGFDLYNIQSTPDGSSRSRHPSTLLQLVVNPTISDTLLLVDPLMPVPEESFTATLNARVPITDGVRVGELHQGLYLDTEYRRTVQITGVSEGTT